MSPETRVTYASKVHGFLAWLANTDLDGDALTDTKTRNWAVREWRARLLTVDKRATANALPAGVARPAPPRWTT